MNSLPEVTLTKEKLHWGIIMPVLLSGLGLFIATLPVLFVCKMFDQAIAQLGPGPHTRHTLPPAINFLIFVPVVLILGIGLTVTWIAYLTSEVTVTDRRLVFRTGVITRSSGELPLENVESLFITEPLLGRLLNYGTVTVTSVGGQKFPLAYIRSPQRFYSLLQEAVNSVKAPKKPALNQTAKQAPPPNNDSRYMPKV